MTARELQARLAQFFLRQEGYYTKAIDGDWGTFSSKASKEWFIDLDKKSITDPFWGTLIALAAQFLMRQHGLYHGQLDGLWGPLSTTASQETLDLGLDLDQPAIEEQQDDRNFDAPYDEAKKHIGVREIPGSKHNPTIVRWLRRVLTWIGDDETPWCSAFVNHCALETGYESTGSLAARSWLEVGQHVALSEAKRGDVVVLWRVSKTGWQGHVAFLDHYNAQRQLLYLLGGNQSNSVNITAYPKYRLLGIRRLRPLDQLEMQSAKL